MQTQQNEIVGKVETVNKSSAECAAYNAAHKAEIELGLVFPQVPTQQVLDEEAIERKREEAGFKRAANMAELLVRITGCKAEDVKVNNFKDGACVKVQGITVRLASNSSRYGHSHISDWKVTFEGSGYGRNGNSSWKKVGDGGILGLNDKQLHKCKESLAEVIAVEKSRAEAKQVKLTHAQRRTAWLADKSNMDIVLVVLGTTYVGYSDEDKITVNEDGTVKIGYAGTFTKAQWEQIAALKKQQAEAMQQLKKSFETVSK